MERPYESMTDQEKHIAFAAICFWHDTALVHSVYVLDCSTPEEAEKKAHEYFLGKSKSFLFQKIKRIEIKPRGAGVFDKIDPVFIRNY